MKYILVYLSYILFLNNLLNANNYQADTKSNENLNDFTDAIKKTFLKSKLNFNQKNDLKINVPKNFQLFPQDYKENKNIKEKNINGLITIETRKKYYNIFYI